MAVSRPPERVHVLTVHVLTVHVKKKTPWVPRKKELSRCLRPALLMKTQRGRLAVVKAPPVNFLNSTNLPTSNGSSFSAAKLQTEQVRPPGPTVKRSLAPRRAPVKPPHHDSQRSTVTCSGCRERRDVSTTGSWQRRRTGRVKRPHVYWDEVWLYASGRPPLDWLLFLKKNLLNTSPMTYCEQTLGYAKNAGNSTDPVVFRQGFSGFPAGSRSRGPQSEGVAFGRAALRGCKGLWESVEWAARALQTDGCQASPPT
ncbi:unnamed protein product [Lota lota]